VSEQDFFFDEEPEPKAPATKGAKAPATQGARPATKAPAKASSGPVTTRSEHGADLSSLYATGALIGVVGLLLGAILGFLLGSALAGNNSATNAGGTGVPAPTLSGQTAPTLTQEQLNATGLPAGHPAIGTSGTAVTTPAP
jgi:hypothetical protein